VSCINQNLSVMGVASCRSTFRCLMLRVRDWSLFDRRACRGFRSAKWPGPTQPNPAQPGLARVPLAPLPTSPCAPPSLPLSFGFPAQQPPSPSSTSLSPRGALGFGLEIAGIWIPGGEFSPPSPSLSFPSPSSSPARPALPPSRAPLRAPSRLRRPRARPGEPPPRPPQRAAPAPAPDEPPRARPR
jgi:hypothetical protein